MKTKQITTAMQAFASLPKVRRPLVPLAIHLLVLLCLLFFLAGCIPLPKGVLGTKNSLPAGESAVFGRIMTETKMPKGTYVSVMDVQRSIPVLKTPPLKDHGGLFCWHLPPGQYAVFELGRGGNTTLYSHRVYAEFEVSSPGQLIYVGCLNISLKEEDGTFVIDDFEQDFTSLKTNYPLVGGTPTKNLFKLENKR